MICGYEFPSGIACGQAHGHEPPHIPWGRGHDVKYHQQWIDRYEKDAKIHRDAIAHILEEDAIAEATVCSHPACGHPRSEHKYGPAGISPCFADDGNCPCYYFRVKEQ